MNERAPQAQIKIRATYSDRKIKGKSSTCKVGERVRPTKTRHIASSGEDLMLWTLLTHRLLQGGSRSIHKLVIDFLLERILKVLGKILGRLGGQRKRNRATRDQKGKNNKNETSPNSTSDESETDKNETGRGTR